MSAHMFLAAREKLKAFFKTIGVAGDDVVPDMTVVVIDIETTGLDDHKHIILEIAARAFHASDLNNHFAEFHELVKPKTFQVLDSCDAMVLEMHTKSGLVAECFTKGNPVQDVINNFRIWLKDVNPTANRGKAFDPKMVILAGNSLHGVDIPFLNKAGVDIESLAHYRVIDITAAMCLLDLVGMTVPVEMRERESNHRAMDDVDCACRQMRALSKYRQPEAVGFQPEADVDQQTTHGWVRAIGEAASGNFKG